MLVFYILVNVSRTNEYLNGTIGEILCMYVIFILCLLCVIKLKALYNIHLIVIYQLYILKLLFHVFARTYDENISILKAKLWYIMHV